jgi:hypothetical protein
MSDAPPSPVHDRQLQILGELAEIGLEVARAVGAAPGPAGDLALAYARVSRAVRLTLMLQSQLIEDAAAAARERARPEPAPALPEDIRKARVTRIVERLVTAEHRHDVDMADELSAEAAERLDDEDVYGDLMQRPMSELVARLCRDLGLEPDWAQLAQELWAQQEIASGDVGAPLSTTRPLPLAGEGDREAVERARHKHPTEASLFQDSA